MASCAAATYPGELADHGAVRSLADEYHAAAVALAATTRRGAQLSSAPYRLVAIQAIELYLNAFLQERGHEQAKLRGLQHDLAARASLAVDAGLVLRRRTLEHLSALHDRREYLTARYAPEGGSERSRCNRVAAALAEIARKTGGRVDRGCMDGATDTSRVTRRGRRWGRPTGRAEFQENGKMKFVIDGDHIEDELDEETFDTVIATKRALLAFQSDPRPRLARFATSDSEDDCWRYEIEVELAPGLIMPIECGLLEAEREEHRITADEVAADVAEVVEACVAMLDELRDMCTTRGCGPGGSSPHGNGKA